MENKAVFTAAFISALLFSGVAGTLFANVAIANLIPYVMLPEITIKSDGSISPQTELIRRNGNTYTLTADSQEQPIGIECSNIIFDGAGRTINITSGDNVGLHLREVNNVTVKNVKVFSRNIYTIYLAGSCNCLITGVQTSDFVIILGYSNTITKSNTQISISSGSNNLITRNNISDVCVGGGSSNNTFFKNNFYLTDYPELFAESLWDNGSIGNYWSNYTTKHPNALEIGNMGIGDTPYVIKRGPCTTAKYPNQMNIDHYPLMGPYDIENDTIAFPTREPSLAALVIAAAGASIAIIGVGLLVYLKKCNHAKTNKHSETAQSSPS